MLTCLNFSVLFILNEKSQIEFLHTCCLSSNHCVEHPHRPFLSCLHTTRHLGFCSLCILNHPIHCSVHAWFVFSFPILIYCHILKEVYLDHSRLLSTISPYIITYALLVSFYHFSLIKIQNKTVRRYMVTHSKIIRLSLFFF